MTCNIPVDRVVRPDSTFSFGVLEVLSVAVYTKGALCSESLAAAVSAVARRSTKNRIDITQLISGFINTHRNNPPKPHTLFSISNFLPRFYPPATKPAHNDILTSRASSCQHNGYGIFRFSHLFRSGHFAFCVIACFLPSFTCGFVVSLVFAIHPPRRNLSYSTASPPLTGENVL